MLYEGISFFNLRFENDVKEYGIQTKEVFTLSTLQFENDVKEYGIQTGGRQAIFRPGLRMM